MHLTDEEIAHVLEQMQKGYGVIVEKEIADEILDAIRKKQHRENYDRAMGVVGRK